MSKARTSYGPIPRWLLVVLVVTLVAGGGVVVVFARAKGHTSAVSPGLLRTEYLKDPIGIDSLDPRLSWIPTSRDRAQKQQAYQIQVVEEPKTFSSNTPLSWDTGRVVSQQNWSIRYEGAPLASGRKYSWRIRLWDIQGSVSEWSDTASWQMGIVDKDGWKESQWISASAPTAPAASLFRRSFHVPSGSISRAVLYVAGLGFHIPYLNSHKIGEREMTPSWCDYTTRIPYVTYDITSLIRPGANNMIGVMLAGGWYNPKAPESWGLSEMPYVDKEKLLLRLEIQRDKGETITITSDNQWKWGTGEVTYSSMYGGEDIDHTRPNQDWSAPDGDDKGFLPVLAGTPPKGTPKLVAEVIPTERRIATVLTTARKTSTGYLYTLEKNTTGGMILLLKGKPGTSVRVQVGESVAGDKVDPAWHSLNNKAKAGRWQQANFTLNSSETESFTTLFTTYSGRFIDLRVTKGQLMSQPQIVVHEIHSDVEAIGSFSSSDQRLNSLHKAFTRAYLNNLHGYPTNSPQRDRIGFGVEATAVAESALMNFGTGPIYSSWLANYIGLQSENGYLPPAAPGYRTHQELNWTPWSGNSIGIISLLLNKYNGDTRTLSSQYPTIRKYTDYLASRLSDWLWMSKGPNPDQEAVDIPKDNSQINTLGVYLALQATAEASRILGEEEHVSAYEEKAEAVKDAFNTTWFNDEKRTYSRNREDSEESEDSEGPKFELAPQSVLAIALATGMVSDDDRKTVLDSLLNDIKKTSINSNYSNHLVTGVIGTRYLFQVLADAGATDLAYRILTQATYPGVLPGALAPGETLQERIIDGGLSPNSPAFGSFDSWLYRGLAGIQTNELISNNLVRIRPGIVPDIGWAEAKLTTIRGNLASKWERTGSKIRYTVTVPVGISAEFSAIGTQGKISINGNPATTFTDPTARERQVTYLLSGTYVIETR